METFVIIDPKTMYKYTVKKIKSNSKSTILITANIKQKRWKCEINSNLICVNYEKKNTDDVIVYSPDDIYDILWNFVKGEQKDNVEIRFFDNSTMYFIEITTKYCRPGQLSPNNYTIHIILEDENNQQHNINIDNLRNTVFYYAQNGLIFIACAGTLYGLFSLF